MDGLRDTLLAMLKSAFNGFDSVLKSAQDVLTGKSFDVDEVWNKIITLSEALKPFCYIIIAICILIELAQVAVSV